MAKLIKYYSKEIINEENENNADTKFEIQQKEYKTTNENFEYWLDVIKKTYGGFGKITYSDIIGEKTSKEIQRELIDTLILDNLNMQIQLDTIIISSLEV